MKNILITLIFTFLIVNLFAQPKSPEDYGLKSFFVKDHVLGQINFYVTKNGIDKNKPLLILLDGSGHLPLYSLLKKDDGSSNIFGSIPIRYNKLSDKYHVVLISKPGTPFLDSLKVNNYIQFLNDYKYLS